MYAVQNLYNMTRNTCCSKFVIGRNTHCPKYVQNYKKYGQLNWGENRKGFLISFLYVIKQYDFHMLVVFVSTYYQGSCVQTKSMISSLQTNNMLQPVKHPPALLLHLQKSRAQSVISCFSSIFGFISPNVPIAVSSFNYLPFKSQTVSSFIL